MLSAHFCMDLNFRVVALRCLLMFSFHEMTAFLQLHGFKELWLNKVGVALETVQA